MAGATISRGSCLPTTCSLTQQTTAPSGQAPVARELGGQSQVGLERLKALYQHYLVTYQGDISLEQ